ncbi:MAG: hypothetical protein WC977_09600 [Anaerovoracaceae bacterium]
MDYYAARERRRELAQHQLERAQYLARVEVLRSHGRRPTFRDYVVYHCYMFIRGLAPLSERQWRGDDDEKRPGVDGDNG